MHRGRFIKLGGKGGLFLFILSSLFFGVLGPIGCGGGGEATLSSQAETVTTTIGELDVGSVAELSFQGGGSSEIIFQNLTGKEQFILAFYSLSSALGNFAVQLQGESGTLASESLSMKSVPSQDAEDLSDLTGSFHNFLRNVERNIDPDEAKETLKLSMGATLRENFKVGDQVQLKVLNSLTDINSYTVITAQVKYITPHVTVFLDNAVANELSQQDIESLTDPFEAHIQEEYDVFGDISDIDNDGKVRYVITPVLNSLGGVGGIVTGFFYGGDLFPESFSASNGGEYIYCHAPDASGRFGVPIPKSFYLSNTGLLCPPHELQHAINFNMKVFVHGGSPDPGPFNEGQSHLAEDIYNGFTKVSNENPSRVSLYLGADLVSLFAGINLAQRGGQYLVYLYYYEQANLGRFPNVADGKELLFKLHNTDLTGSAALDKITGEPIGDVLSDFFVALYLSNTGLNNDPRFNFTAINLRTTQDDNRFTVLNGPFTQEANGLPLPGNIGASSSDYTLFTGETLIGEGSTLKLIPDASMLPGATLIRIQDK